MDEDRKTALTIGLITVYAGHALLKKKATNRVDQMAAGSFSGLSYYLGSGLMNTLGISEQGILRNVLEASTAYLGAEAGIKVSHWGKQKIKDLLQRNVQESYDKEIL